MRTLRLPLAGTLCLVVAAVLPAAAVAQDDDPAPTTSDAPAEVTVVSDLVYATGRSPDDATELTLTLYRADGSEETPMVIDVAGGWAVDAQALAERGVSVFSVPSVPDRWSEVMRDADPAAYRAMVDAVACAVRFARGSEYGSETATLVLAGWSATGALAAHVALAGEDLDRLWDEYEASGGGPPAQYDCTVAEASTSVDAIVGVAGAYDVMVGYDSSGYGGPYGRDFLLEHEPELWELLDGTVGLHPGLRVRLLHGEDDGVIPFENSVVFEALLADAGYDVELTAYGGFHDAPTDLTTEAVMGLLD